MIGVADPDVTGPMGNKDKDKPPGPLLRVVKGVWKVIRAFVFVVAGFAFWYLFASLAKIVIRCELVSLWPWPPTRECAAINLGSLTNLTWTYVAILITTLIVAIWAAKRLVFPTDD